MFHYQNSDYPPRLFYKTLTNKKDLEVDINLYKDQIQVEKIEQKAKSPV